VKEFSFAVFQLGSGSVTLQELKQNIENLISLMLSIKIDPQEFFNWPVDSKHVYFVKM